MLISEVILGLDPNCPWYQLNKKEVVNYEIARENSRARAMQVSDQKVISLNKEEKLEMIKKYQQKYRDKKEIEFLLPIILATDITTGRTLVLDGNKTIIALYRNYQEDSSQDKLIPIIHIIGKFLEDIFQDFEIVNRPNSL